MGITTSSFIFLCLFWLYWGLNSWSFICRQALEPCPQLFFVLVIFWDRVLCLPGLDWTEILLVMLPCVAGMAGSHHHAQLLVQMGTELFAHAGLKPTSSGSQAWATMPCLTKIFCSLDFELRGLQGRYSTTWAKCQTFHFFLFLFFCSPGTWTQDLLLKLLHQTFLCKCVFEIGSRELVAWAGFKPRSSWSTYSEYFSLIEAFTSSGSN
jgi:hypothetical protein